MSPSEETLLRSTVLITYTDKKKPKQQPKPNPQNILSTTTSMDFLVDYTRQSIPVHLAKCCQYTYRYTKIVTSFEQK